ncbi:MAG: ligase-associated DNA damage response exonuclease [Bdellovibrionales bacterium]|nr:ligase-associated DNA damage response exonuclease [Bdellovibrionales bacterium]
MLTLTPKGLYCPAGDFYIDPKRRVDHAVITHAHSDHARRGSSMYYCVHSGVDLLRTRIGAVKVKTYSFGERFEINGVSLSLHPAGHILGSSQVRIEHGGEVWVASGDYKRDEDPTCEPFESVACDVFVTEATFGTPAFTWEKGQDLGLQIFEWWSRNRQRGVNSVLFAYSLGKAQRVLGVLQKHTRNPVHCDPLVSEMNRHYRAQGIALAPTICLSQVTETQPLKGELFLVPQSFLKSSQSHLLGPRYETAFASGWMAGGQRGFGGGYDHGFVMSDHADWNDLLRTIKETGARRVYVQHRGEGALVKHLRQLGVEAFPESDLIGGRQEQLTLF